jgi:hypothetical protein
MAVNKSPEWITRGKSIRQLIKELQTFEDQDLEVRISLDDGNTHKPISLVGRQYIVQPDGLEYFCLLVNSEKSQEK